MSNTPPDENIAGYIHTRVAYSKILSLIVPFAVVVKNTHILADL